MTWEQLIYIAKCVLVALVIAFVAGIAVHMLLEIAERRRQARLRSATQQQPARTRMAEHADIALREALRGEALNEHNAQVARQNGWTPMRRRQALERVK